MKVIALAVVLIACAYAQTVTYGTPSCASYCSVIGQKCGYAAMGLINSTVCASICANLTTGTNPVLPLGTSSTSDHSDGEFSLGCRQYYAENALNENDNNTCEYAGLISDSCFNDTVEGEYQQQACSIYCAANAIGCSPTFTDPRTGVYNVSLCMAACNAGYDANYYVEGDIYPINTNGEDDIDCRTYHALNGAYVSASSHCPHASPSGGGGVCGSIDEMWIDWCYLISGICESDSLFPFFDTATCETEMASFPVSSMQTSYGPVGSGGANSSACRYWNALAAGVLGTSHCQVGGINSTLCDITGTAAAPTPSSSTSPTPSTTATTSTPAASSGNNSGSSASTIAVSFFLALILVVALLL